jgi:hypothetical protein
MRITSTVSLRTIPDTIPLTESHLDIDPIIELFYNPGGKGLDAWSQSILPLSRGSVRINSTDPTIDPIANTHFLTVDVDIQIAIRMARGIAQAATTPPFSDLISKTALADSGLPAPDAADEEVRNWVLAT